MNLLNLKSRSLGLFVIVLLIVLPGAVMAQDGSASVECDNGASFDNGITVTINQMRSGFTYTATAIGLDGFDPVLAVLGESGEGLCSDDDANAAEYEFILPSTGEIAASNRSAQVIFDQNSSEAFADISLVVGGYDSQLGEFVLILEGMAVTAEDNAGDPFTIQITPAMAASDAGLSIYMLGRDSGLDPLMYLVTPDFEIAQDGDGNEIYCDDAGNSQLCWTDSDDLEDSGVATNTGVVRGGATDAVLSFNLSGFEFLEDPDDNRVTFIMSSYNRQTYGQYVLLFHMGLAEPQVSLGGGGEGGIGSFQGGGGK